MKKIILSLLIGLTFLFAGFQANEGISVPENKLDKAISKIWKTESIILSELFLKETNPCCSDMLVFSINSDSDSLGYALVNRVNSCRAGGCNIEHDEEAISFEFFDYFIITDMNLQVLKVSIYNYQATQGHEVMSKGWLSQFIGFSGQEKLVYGKDIEAISGATVSAVAMNEDIYATIDCLKNQLH